MRRVIALGALAIALAGCGGSSEPRLSADCIRAARTLHIPAKLVDPATCADNEAAAAAQRAALALSR